MTDPSDPSLEPSYLLKAIRSFVDGVAAKAGEGEQPETEKPSPAADGDGEALGWEEAGCLVWDAAALPDDAAFLLQHDLPAVLPPLLTAAAAREQWRALEIGLGVMGNLACHPAAKAQLLQQAALAELLLDQLLWVDDAAALAELCRCLASLLSDSDRQAAEAWWVLVKREETLGRLVWMVECTLNPTLLERALNLLCALVSAATAAGGEERRLVPQLLALDLMPLLASVLHGWVVRLRAEQQLFTTASGEAAAVAAGGSAAGSPAAEPAGAAAAEAGGAGQPGDPPSSVPPAIAPPAPGSPAQWDEKVVAAAEVTEGAALEALGLLEALVADTVGEAAANASVSIKEALLRLIAESANRGMRALSTALLAGLQGAGPLLVQHPQAVEGLLGRLEAGDGAKRPKAAGGSATGSTEAAEEVEAAWALLSALAQALSMGAAAADEEAQAGAEGEAAEGGGASAATEADAVLRVLAERSEVLCRDWASSSPALGMHQWYVLGRLTPLLVPRVGDEAAERLRAAAAAITGADSGGDDVA